MATGVGKIVCGTCHTEAEITREVKKGGKVILYLRCPNPKCKQTHRAVEGTLTLTTPFIHLK